MIANIIKKKYRKCLLLSEYILYLLNKLITMKIKVLLITFNLLLLSFFLSAQQNTAIKEDNQKNRIQYKSNENFNSYPINNYNNAIHPLILQYRLEYDVIVISNSIYSDAPLEKKQYIDKNPSKYLIVEDPIVFLSEFYTTKKMND